MQRLELRKTDVNSYSVAVDGKVADRLTIDEAMGCIASAMFADRHHPLFVKDIWDHVRTQINCGLTITTDDQTELIKMSERTMPKMLPKPSGDDIPLF